MEQRAEYGPWRERPRLTVVTDEGATYSALPHAVLFSGILDGSVRTYAVLQAHWFGPEGECTASHVTLAAEARCTLRSLRRYLDELIAAGFIIERTAGSRRAKAYSPVPIGQKRPIEAVNTSILSDWTPSNETKTTVQSDKNDSSNETKTTHSYKKTPVKKTPEEELPPTGVGAAVAAAPATAEAKAKKSRGTRCPETFPLEPRHYVYAAEYGYADIAKVAAITDAFLNHHRFKGTIGKDWYAGWQNWVRKQREIDDERASRQPTPSQRNGYKPPVSDKSREITKQHSKWSDDYYSNGIGAAGRRKVGEPTDGR